MNPIRAIAVLAVLLSAALALPRHGTELSGTAAAGGIPPRAAPGAPALLAPTVPAPPASWHWQNPLPHGNSLNAASCADATTCLAAGSATVMASHDAGKSWSVTLDKALGSLASLSCPERLLCYGVALEGATAISIVGSHDGGVTWSRLWQGTPGIMQIDCPTGTTCYAIGQYAPAMLATKDAGRSWKRITAVHPVAISCPTALVCYGPLATNLISSPPPTVVVTKNGGATWTSHQVGLAKGAAQLSVIRCPSPTTCLLVAYGNVNAQYLPFMLRTDNGGASWQRQNFASNTAFRGAALACPSTSICYLAGDNGAVSGVLVATRDGGQHWVRQKDLPFTAEAIACGDTTTCVAAGYGGALIRTGDGWAKRSMKTHNTVGHYATLLNYGLTSLACGSKAVCYAGGRFATMVRTTDRGAHWVPESSSLQRLAGSRTIGSLACANPVLCFAGLYAAHGQPAVLLSTRDGLTWSAKPGEGYEAVTCVSAAACYAGGPKGAFAVTHDVGASWVRLKTPLSGKPYAVHRIVCPVVDTCYAILKGPMEPPPHPSSNLGAIMVTHDGGVSWSSTLTDPYPFDIACLTASDCFAPVGGIYVSNEIPALVTRDGGRTWIKASFLPPGTNWRAVTCASSTTCYVVARNGDIAVTHDAGHTWMPEQSPTFNGLDAITCTGPNACFAAGEFGTILARG